MTWPTGLVFGKQRDRRTNLARCAISALHCIAMHEGGLHRVESVIAHQAFDSGDFVTGVHHRKREATVDALPIDDHRAGPALALIASLFGAGECESFAVWVKQCCWGVE